MDLSVRADAQAVTQRIDPGLRNACVAPGERRALASARPSSGLNRSDYLHALRAGGRGGIIGKAGLQNTPTAAIDSFIFGRKVVRSTLR